MHAIVIPRILMDIIEIQAGRHVTTLVMRGMRLCLLHHMPVPSKLLDHVLKLEFIRGQSTVKCDQELPH